MKLLIVLIVSLTGLSAFAEQDRDTCFRESSVRRWRALDSRTLDVWSVRGLRYRVEVWSCFELPWSDRIAFRSFSGFDRICRGDDVLVLDNFSNKVVDRCNIRRITRLH